MKVRKMPCTVCGKKIDARGINGHMRSHPTNNHFDTLPPKKQPEAVDLVSWRNGYREGFKDAKAA